MIYLFTFIYPTSINAYTEVKKKGTNLTSVTNILTWIPIQHKLENLVFALSVKYFAQIVKYFVIERTYARCPVS